MIGKLHNILDGEAFVIGAGKTSFDYNKINTDNIFLVNYTIYLAYLFKRPIWTSLHVDFFTEALKTYNGISCINNNNKATSELDSRISFEFIDTDINKLSFYSIKHMVETNRLYGTQNSMILALQVARICGIKKVKMVGSSMFNGQFHEEYDSRVFNGSNPSPRDCYEAVLRFSQVLNYPIEFL